MEIFTVIPPSPNDLCTFKYLPPVAVRAPTHRSIQTHSHPPPARTHTPTQPYFNVHPYHLLGSAFCDCKKHDLRNC